MGHSTHSPTNTYSRLDLRDEHVFCIMLASRMAAAPSPLRRGRQPDLAAQRAAEKAASKHGIELTEIRNRPDPTRAGPPERRSRQSGRKPKRAPYRTEIAALAETTAELPSPSREGAIRVVAAIVGLFERVWRELVRQGDKPSKSP